ncbi:MAG: hypothetical protein ACLRQX_06425 [Turicibacter sanguinis]
MFLQTVASTISNEAFVLGMSAVGLESQYVQVSGRDPAVMPQVKLLQLLDVNQKQKVM